RAGVRLHAAADGGALQRAVALSAAALAAPGRAGGAGEGDRPQLRAGRADLPRRLRRRLRERDRERRADARGRDLLRAVDLAHAPAGATGGCVIAAGAAGGSEPPWSSISDA